MFRRKKPTAVQPSTNVQESYIEPTEAERVEPKRGFFSRMFTRKRTQKPTIQTASVPLKPVYTNYKSQLNKNTQNVGPYVNVSQHTGRYESIKDAYDRDFVFLHKAIHKEDPSANPTPVLDPQTKRELQKEVLRRMYNKETDSFDVPSDMNRFIQSLTGLDEHTFNEQLRQYENNPPPGTMASDLIPTPGSGGIARMIQPVLYSEDELARTADTQDKICGAQSKFTNSVKNMNQGVCVLLGYSIPALFKLIQSDQLYSSALYIVIQPQFHPSSSEQKYKGSKVYDTSASLRGSGVRNLELGALGRSVILEHVMEHRGLEVIHPRLGFLFQTKLASMWNKGYYNPDLSDLDRIVLLTLQKYAAIRRYMWTKDPALASQVYEVDPQSIANELRAPYFTLPNEPAFNASAFFDEFRKNQLWVSGIVKYKSYSDPGLDAFLPTNPDLNIVQMAKNVSNKSTQSYPLGTNPVFPWFSPETQKDFEQTPINSIPEEDQVRQEQFGTAIPYTESAAAAETARNILGTSQPIGFTGSVLPNMSSKSAAPPMLRSSYIESIIRKLTAKRTALNSSRSRNLTVKNRIASARIDDEISVLESTLAATRKMERQMTPQQKRSGIVFITNNERNNYQGRYGKYGVSV